MDVLQIWKDNAGYVLNLCERYLRDPEMAEDVRQEVFLKIINNVRAFKSRSAVRTWLYAITFRCCVDYFRLKKKQELIMEEFMRTETFYLNDCQSPIWEVNRISRTQCPISQLFIELHYGEGWEREEIAAVFGYSIAHVNKKIQTGVQYLQKLI